MFFSDVESKNFLCRWRWKHFFSSNMPICYYRIRNFAELKMNISVICEGGADAEQNFLESERTRSQKNETLSISDTLHMQQEVKNGATSSDND